VDQLFHLIQSGIQPTQCRTSGHTDLSGAPVDLQVVFHKPSMPKDNGHSANTSDMEGGLLQITSILDYMINNFNDVAGLIESSIHIVDRDGSGETLGA